MTHLLPIHLLAPVLAAAEAGAPEMPQVPLQTVILLAMLVMLGFMGKKLVDLGRAVRSLEARLEAGAPAPRRAEAPAASAAADPAGHISMETLVVISAAVAATCGRKAQIVSVSENPSTIRPWSLEGRRQIFASHSVR